MHGLVGVHGQGDRVELAAAVVDRSDRHLAGLGGVVDHPHEPFAQGFRGRGEEVDLPAALGNADLDR